MTAPPRFVGFKSLSLSLSRRIRLIKASGYRDHLLPLLFLPFSVISQANESQFSCGDIQNIGFPFALQGQMPTRCSDQAFALACDNNRTVLNLYAEKYYLQDIDYRRNGILLVDAHIHSNACSSFPVHSLTGQLQCGRSVLKSRMIRG